MKQATLRKYIWYFSLSRREEPLLLEKILFNSSGFSALKCFHAKESTGQILPCKEPKRFNRYLVGKLRHGNTVDAISSGLLEGLVTQKDLEEYPNWVKKEILAQGTKKALQKLGFVPTFVKNGLL